MDLYGYLGIFAVTWILGLVAGVLVWRRGKDWPYKRRIGRSAFGAAIFFTPSLVGGHGGAAPFPGLVALIAQPSSIVFYAIAFVPTWWACLAFFAAFEAVFNWLWY